MGLRVAFERVELILRSRILLKSFIFKLKKICLTKRYYPE